MNETVVSREDKLTADLSHVLDNNTLWMDGRVKGNKQHENKNCKLQKSNQK